MAIQQAGKLASQALHNGMQTSTNTSTQKSAALPDAWVAAIFKRLGLNYGNLWTSQFPTQQRTDEMIAEWGKALANVQPHKIKHALEHLPDMPPTLPQFRRLCECHNDDWEHRGAAYRPFPTALPKPKAKPDTVANALSAIRARPRMTPDEMAAEARRLREAGQ